nr:hypothetical protein [Brevundimonas naejangsanensis]
MGIGAQIFTDNGAIQIDGDYAALCLRQTGRATLTNLHATASNAIGVKARTVDVTYSGQSGSTPLFAMSKTGAAGEYGVIAVDRVGNTWTFRVIGDERFPTFDYFIFDKPSPNPSGAGFEVYSETGDITFSSFYRPLEVRGFIGSLSGSTSVSAGRQYAVAFSGYIGETLNEETNSLGQRWWHWQHDLVVAGVANNVASISHHMINGGSERNDQQQPTLPRPSGGLANWGAGSGALVIDVTDITDAVTPPSSISVSTNATTRTISTTEQTSITDAVTATASGHSGTLSYLWEKVGGSSVVNIYGSSTTNSLRTQVTSLAVGSSVSAQFRCVVTSSTGQIGYGPVVTFTHQRTAQTNVPNPITFPRHNLTSNDHDVTSGGTPFQITGISQAITLRFERYNPSIPAGSSLILTVYSGPSASGPWTNQGNLVDVGAYHQRDVTNVTNGTWFKIDARGITSSGKKTITFDLAVWNLTRNEQMVRVNNNTLIIDNDDNHNVADYRPDPISIPDLTLTTNEPSGYTNAPKFQITSINQQITLRFTRGNQVDGGGIFTRRLFIYKSTTGQNGPWQEFFIGAGAQGVADITANNGDWFYLQAYCDTTKGKGTTSFTGYIDNLSDNNTRIATYNISATVDADDNYNYNYSPNAVDWPNISGTTTSPSLTTSTATRTISGIDKPINIRASISNFSGSNVASSSSLDTYIGGTRHGGSTGLANGHWSAGNASNNQAVHFVSILNPVNASLPASASYTVTVTNQTTGGTVLDTFTVHQSANVDDVTPDAMSWPNVSWSTPNNVVYGAYSGNGPIVSGLSKPITLRFQFISASSNTTWQNFEITNHSHNTHATIVNYVSGSYADVVVGNGDSFICKVSCGTDSGIRNTSGTVRVINLSDNNAVIGTFNVDVTVDNDDNYNKADYDLNPIDWGNVWFSTDDAVGWGSNAARTMSGINRNIIVSGSISNVVGNAPGTIYAVSTTRGNLASQPFRQGGWLPFEVLPNEQIYFYVDAFTDSGRKEFGFDFHVYNHTTGAFIDHLYCSGIVDANDDHNKGQPLSVSVSPDWLEAPFEFVNQGRFHSQYVGRAYINISGGTAPYTVTWERQSGGPGFSVTSQTSYADFYYTGMTNYNEFGSYALRVTDSLGRVAYSNAVYVAASAGDSFN